MLINVILFYKRDSILSDRRKKQTHITVAFRGPPLEYWGGGWSFLEIHIFVEKIGEIKTWSQGIVEINILSTKEVEINII